MIESGESRIP